jgi:uroporphyrinogen decarboxylase
MTTGKERIAQVLWRQPADRVGLFEVFWTETARRWSAEGHFSKPEMVEDHFGLDLRRCRALDIIANLDAGEEVVDENDTTQFGFVGAPAASGRREEVIAETETTRLVRDGNGAVLRWLKGSSGAPEHVDFLVKDRPAWEEYIRPHLVNEATRERRITFDFYRAMRTYCTAHHLFFTCGVVGPFDLMTPMCGHEHLLAGMAAEPGWARDMVGVYSRITIELMETLFAREGLPDGLWVWDDLAFKQKPFMSPVMFRELICPAYRLIFQWAHARKLPVILHSDGFVEPLLPDLIEAGIDCLQPLEVKAGMDLLRVKKRFGDRIALIGGMDARVLETNDLAAVRAELEHKLPGAMAGSGYVLQADHSVSNLVNYETYQYFVETGLRLGTNGGAER